VQLLSVPLTLTDNKHPASIRTAATSTAKQVLSLMLEELTNIDTRNPWLLNSCLAFFDELIHVASIPTPASTPTVHHQPSKIGHVSQSFALDCIFEIADIIDRLKFPVPDASDRVYSQLFPLVQLQLGNVRKHFDLEFDVHGLASSSSNSSRVFRLARLAVLRNLSGDHTAVRHICTLLYHCLQPVTIDAVAVASQKSDESRGLDAVNIFSKLSLNSISNITSALARNPFLLPHDSFSNSSSQKSIPHEQAYMEFNQHSYQNSTVLVGGNNGSCVRFVAMHPAIHALEILSSAVHNITTVSPTSHGIKMVMDILVHCCTMLSAIVPPWLSNRYVQCMLFC
jgi:hypothetical protein